RVALHLGAELGEVRATETTVGFTAGSERRDADVLIAADGVRSAIRTRYFRHTGPTSLGRSAWRATLRSEDIRDVFSNEVCLWLGPGAHLVHYPIAKGALLNIVVIAPGAGSVPPLEAFGRLPRRALEEVSAWRVSPLVAVDASLAWTKGRVALIG